MRLSPLLLATTMLALPVAAHAREGDPARAPAPTAGDDPQPTGDAAEPAQSDIIITGNRETRQVQQLTQKDISILLPGTSPLKAIEKLPGVNFLAADPFGLYEWSQRVSIRGFNQNQLGFTLDGIPLGDGSYGNTNGLHISRAISSENIALTRVSQGSGSIGTQAINNLGGTLEFFSRDPSPTFALEANGTIGSYSTSRAFARLDTGAFGDTGIAAYVSYGRVELDKWKGVGRQFQQQINAKFVAPVVDHLRLVGTFNYSERRENDYQDLSLGIINRLGLGWDNISDNFPLAVQIADVAANRGDSGAPRLNPAAGTVYPAPIRTVDDAYFDASGLRNDYLASLGFETDKEAPIRATVKGYYHSNHGQGTWFTPYVASPTGVPISVRTTEYDIRRRGVFGSLGFDWLFNDVTVGIWYEVNEFRQARRFYGLDSRTTPTRFALEFQAVPFFTQWDWRYNTETVQYYVQDRLSFGRLTINFGWKGFDVRNRGTPIVAGGLAQGNIRVTDWFQPHAGFNVALGRAEVFGGFTQVTRAFTSAATSGPFATTQAGFDALGNLRPESSDTYELGTRFRGGRFTGSVVGYYVDFSNRLLAFTQGAGIIGNPPILQNVGSVRSYGVEVAGDVRLPYGFGLFATYSFNDSTYRNDVVNRAGVVVARTAGRTVVDAPRDLFRAELRYDQRRFFGRLGFNYTSRRFFTFENDQSVPSFTLVDLTLGLRMDWPNIVKGELQFNATNLFNERYIATIGSNGFTNRGDNQTLLAGAPQQFFVTFRTQF
ncbi:TonB-dependent receptor [Sphingomonas sp.]|uniref:TonB-dependent receptor domain-containing protein n=1 Tax=Sphingomonas sp. TaxID=28214 RepID=UPI001E04E9E4|nr:TonB-dependent receptor [Sphingomonas sp.]MBX9796889.1 TonB-dependent receptor [Sphingomonas sp.]